MKKPVYLPFANGQWRLAMGMKPLQLQDWIEIDDDFADQVSLRTQLLNQRHTEVFACLPGSEAAQQEVLELLVDHLLRYFPQHYQRQENSLINQVTGQVWQFSDFTTNPLDLAGRLVQEDLCLMLLGVAGHFLSAASLCFPLRWRLQEKLGLPMSQIHGQVPGYADKLKQPVDNFFDRLQPNHPGYRFNWSIVDVPDLFLAQSKFDPQAPTITVETAGETLWLRVERQTLRRLPRSQAILFTIRSYVYPLSQVVTDAAIARSLADAIQQIPTAMQSYKNLLPIREVLMAYLEAIATASMSEPTSLDLAEMIHRA